MQKRPKLCIFNLENVEMETINVKKINQAVVEDTEEQDFKYLGGQFNKTFFHCFRV